VDVCSFPQIDRRERRRKSLMRILSSTSTAEERKKKKRTKSIGGSRNAETTHFLSGKKKRSSSPESEKEPSKRKNDRNLYLFEGKEKTSKYSFQNCQERGNGNDFVKKKGGRITDLSLNKSEREKEGIIVQRALRYPGREKGKSEKREEKRGKRLEHTASRDL